MNVALRAWWIGAVTFRGRLTRTAAGDRSGVGDGGVWAGGVWTGEPAVTERSEA